jgi:hypothetical protein
MTAAGIALIAGGLATLICFRSVLFGRRDRDAEPADIQPKSRRAPGNRHRSRAPEPLIPPAEEDPRGPLASIGLLEENDDRFPYDDEPNPDEPEFTRREEPGARDYAPDPGDYVPDPGEYAPDAGEYAPEPVDFGPEPVEYVPEPAELVGLELVPDLPPDDPEPAYSGDRYGHRVQGWVRPEYRPVRAAPPSGEYWTPIPVDLDPDPEPSAKGYGWPAPVERLPAVPDYEPATGFDLAPVEHEPTEIDFARRREQRVRLPRTWSDRNDKRERREWRTENEALPTTPLFADDAPPARRRRPRPRPRPSAEPSDRSTRVYVSRHAAEPPPR